MSLKNVLFCQKISVKYFIFVYYLIKANYLKDKRSIK